jgi:hypothetical protein
LYVVSGEHSGVLVISIGVASDATVSQAAHRPHTSDLSHACLFLAAHVAVTVSDAAIHFHILSWKHLSTHFSVISWMKFAAVMVPIGCDVSLDVIQFCVSHKFRSFVCCYVLIITARSQKRNLFSGQTQSVASASPAEPAAPLVA